MSLLDRWLEAGAPGRAGWVLEAQAVLGDDETARRLAAHVRAWPSEGALARAGAAVDVIARIGTEGALIQLHRLTTKVRTPSVRARAQERLAEVAASLELTPDQLADRLVPDLGLDAAGTLELDFGPRRFTAGFDERLKPFVADGTGTRRKDLPKPGVRDDPALAPAAVKRFTLLKQVVRLVAAEQIPRFERAMVMGRRWTGADFHRLIVGHPLVWHVARRLVWATFDTFDASGAPLAAMRVAEDRTLAGLDDSPVTLADDAPVGVAHPLHLGGTLVAWAQLFADYEILQPFPQLGRASPALTALFSQLGAGGPGLTGWFSRPGAGGPGLTAEERERDVLARFAGVKAPSGRFAGLTHGAWRRTDGQHGGWGGIVRDLPGDRIAVVELDPGLHYGDVSVDPVQTITGVRAGTRHADGRGWQRVPFADLDPISAFELVRDLEEATA
ncbi:DUF4132 domain-containing protein [Dactylosporangium sp. NBC_01737]|nr:DUF4132 domain-containing protein [Dactylosporangium sp. NBC_01737]